MNPGTVISTIFSSKRRVLLVGFVCLGVLIGGGFALGVIGAPGIDDINNSFGEVSNESTTIETELVVSNPNPIDLDVQNVSITYTISMNDIEMAHGERTGLSIDSGTSSLDLETRMMNDAIPDWWVSHLQNDEHTVVGIDATTTADRFGRSRDISRTHEIETDLLTAFNSEETRPVNADNPIVNDPVLYINETRGRWGMINDEVTEIDMEFVVYNPNLEPYAITELGYTISMNDIVMGDGETHESHLIQSRELETIPLTTRLNNQNLDEWWVSHLDHTHHGHQVSELRIEFYAIVELPTGDEITIPLDMLTYEETIETDIFDEGGVVGEPVDRTEDDSDGDDDPADDDDAPPNDDDSDDETENGNDDDGIDLPV